MLSEEQIQEISKAVLKAEMNTSGEIVPMILQQSDRYSGAHWRMGILVALCGAMLATYLFPEWEPVWFLWLELPLLGLGYVLAGIPALKRFLVGQGVMAEEVHQRVVQQFYALGFSETKARTGIVIAVSLLEHRVEVLADVAIDRKVPSGAWNHLVEQLVKQMRAGELGSGMVEAIEAAGKVLCEHFPATHENPDELPNRLILG